MVTGVDEALFQMKEGVTELIAIDMLALVTSSPFDSVPLQPLESF
jgi:hypothetical protein